MLIQVEYWQMQIRERSENETSPIRKKNEKKGFNQGNDKESKIGGGPEKLQEKLLE